MGNYDNKYHIDYNDFFEVRQLLEEVKINLKILPKGVRISKQQYKVPIKYCENKINNKDYKFVIILFIIYFYDVCDFTEGITFLQNVIESGIIKNLDLLEELNDIANGITLNSRQCCTYNKENWGNWDMLEQVGIHYWMYERVFPKFGEEENILISKLRFIANNSNIKAYLHIGEVYEYCGEWENAFDVYTEALNKFDPITIDDVELRKKIVESSLRTCNLKNYEKTNFFGSYNYFL
jgi:tetratricopeptide (TPR) repeat protein